MDNTIIILSNEDKKYFDADAFKLIINHSVNDSGIEIVVLDKNDKRLYSVYGYSKK